MSYKKRTTPRRFFVLYHDRRLLGRRKSKRTKISSYQNKYLEKIFVLIEFQICFNFLPSKRFTNLLRYLVKICFKVGLRNLFFLQNLQLTAQLLEEEIYFHYWFCSNNSWNWWIKYYKFIHQFQELLEQNQF